jgi:hypothetical protein
VRGIQHEDPHHVIFSNHLEFDQHLFVYTFSASQSQRHLAVVLKAKLYVYLSMCLASFTPVYLTTDRCDVSSYSKYSGNLLTDHPSFPLPSYFYTGNLFKFIYVSKSSHYYYYYYYYHHHHLHHRHHHHHRHCCYKLINFNLDLQTNSLCPLYIHTCHRTTSHIIVFEVFYILHMFDKKY